MAGPVRSASDDAKVILDASGVKGGLVVHLGCGDGKLTAGLHANERYIVQGLDHDAKKVAAARRHVQSLGLYGRVSIRHWDRDFLPYGDNAVNLLIVASEEWQVASGEIARVLTPRGVVAMPGKPGEIPEGLRALDSRNPTLDTRSPAGLKGWSMYSKPVPPEIDDWTHYLHDAGNNAVAEDDRVGPPRHMQWKSGPMWARSHEFASSVHALVSANGRLIGIIDEGIIGQPRGVPALWTLIARDAFNGILLWRRPCATINPHGLAAVGDRVYVTLNRGKPLSILDAATGETLHTCEEAGRVEELAVAGGRLVLNTQLPNTQSKSARHVAVADAKDGRLIWKKPAKSIAKNTLVADEKRICYFNGEELVCLSLDSGDALWRTKAKSSGRGYAILYGGAVFLTGGSTKAFSLETGKPLWTGPDGSPHARNPPGLFGAGGLIWRAWDHVDPRSFLWQHREEVRRGFDPLTGEVRKTITAKRLVTAGHHIRCYPPKATKRYLLLNKRGVEFFDLEGDNHMRANWTRAACGFGMLPANGFLYTPPAQCFCYQGVLLSGLNALSASRVMTAHEQKPRLERGPAFGAGGRGQSPPSALRASAGTSVGSGGDWPTYRGNVRRSGSIEADLPVELERLWETQLCAPAFAPGEEQEEQGVEEPGLVLKALDAKIHGGGARKDAHGVVAWRGKDTYISWDATIEKTGRHPVWVSQANAGRGGSVFELAVGDKKLTGAIRHTADFYSYIWLRAGEVEIAKPGKYTVTLKPLKQVDGRLGNVAAVVIGGTRPPAGGAVATEPPTLRDRPHAGLTPPVAAGGLVVVAEPDAHAVHAVDAKSGKRRWTFVADGRVDSPPTLFDGLCLFGSTDGHVYCVSAADGQLVWRFRAAPEERQICAMGQVESAWPVHGSVLVRDGKVYCTAGRSTYLDGGIHVYALEPRSGELIHETLLHSEEPDTTEYGGRPFDMDGARGDILVAGKEDIYLFQKRLNPDLTLDSMPRITKLGDREGEAHLITTDGFLDKTWFNRTYWMHSRRWPGYYFTYRGPKSGQILVFDDENTYALKVYTERRGHSPEFQPGSGYRLIADRNTTRPVLDVMEIGAEKGRGFSRTELPIWNRRVPIRAHGMLLANKHLYLAGPPDLPAGAGAYEAMIGKRGALFRVVATDDGESLAEFKMKEVPVFDGLIAAGERLYMATMDGTLICFGGKK